jgi:predicted transcriptional regulator
LDAKSRPALSEAELAVLRVLWESGPGTVREISEALAGKSAKRWAYTTVQTLLQRLKAKGYAESSSGDGLAHVFRAGATREDLLKDRLQDLADELCEGTPAPLVLTLVENHRFTPEEVARFRAILDREAAAKPKRPPSKPH